jgi:hypothetical protein
MRAVPSSSLRASLSTGSCVRIGPSRGSLTVPRPQWIAPVSRNESRHFPRLLNFGNPSSLPLRCPFLDLT